MTNPLADFGEHPGYFGYHTQQEAPGAWPNDTVVKKVNSEEGDSTPNGTLGRVLGSMYHESVGYMYFVEWADKLGFAISCVGLKLEAVGHKESSTVN